MSARDVELDVSETRTYRLASGGEVAVVCDPDGLIEGFDFLLEDGTLMTVEKRVYELAPWSVMHAEALLHPEDRTEFKWAIVNALSRLDQNERISLLRRRFDPAELRTALASDPVDCDPATAPEHTCSRPASANLNMDVFGGLRPPAPNIHVPPCAL